MIINGLYFYFLRSTHPRGRRLIMAPMAVADEAEVLQSIANELGGRKAELAR